MEKKILIIDDEEEMCWALAKPLNKDGFEVFTATEGNAGFQVFKEQQPDLILLDIKIKDTSGLDILEQIRAVNKDIPVFIMTGYSTMDMAVEAMDKGATGFFTKPLKISNLLETVKELLLPGSGENVINMPWNNRHD